MNCNTSEFTLVFRSVFQTLAIRVVILKHVHQLNVLAKISKMRLEAILSLYSPSFEWLERNKYAIGDFNEMNQVHLEAYCESSRPTLPTFKYLLQCVLENNRNRTIKEEEGEEEKPLLVDYKALPVLWCGLLDIYSYLVEANHLKCLERHIDEAAMSGNLELIKYIHFNNKSSNSFNNNDKCSTKAIDMAAAIGNLDIVKFLSENRTEGCTVDAMDNAAMKYHLPVVKYLNEHRTEGCTTRALDMACGGDEYIVTTIKGHHTTIQRLKLDNLPLIKYLSENRTEGCSTMAMDFAARNGRLDIVQYLSENRTEGCTENALIEAARYGHIDMVKYIVENRKRSEISYQKAIESGALNNRHDIVEYLYEKRKNEGLLSKLKSIFHKK